MNRGYDNSDNDDNNNDYVHLKSMRFVLIAH